MFLGYVAVMYLVLVALNRVSHLLPVPGGVSVTWWAVDRILTIGAIADVIGVFLPLWVYLHWRGKRIRDLGFVGRGTVVSWSLVIIGQMLISAWDVTRGGASTISHVFSFYWLYAGAVIGVAAGISEEVFFRGFIMSELKAGGNGPVVQVLISAILFGLLHIAYGGWDIPVLTGLLGAFWSVIYLIGRRSLWPSMVAHAVNDALLIPAVYYVILTHISKASGMG
jgi:hypothetical protein